MSSGHISASQVSPWSVKWQQPVKTTQTGQNMSNSNNLTKQHKRDRTCQMATTSQNNRNGTEHVKWQQPAKTTQMGQHMSNGNNLTKQQKWDRTCQMATTSQNNRNRTEHVK